jgi:CheY-like chemotaxis protein
MGFMDVAETSRFRLRTLVVDDYRDGLAATALLLKHLACEVRLCGEPHVCSELAMEFRPQLVLLDLAMPTRDGFTTARELRGLDIPRFMLVAFTGRGEAESRRRCQEEGFDSFLLKPAALADLRAVIEVARELTAAPPDKTALPRKSTPEDCA